MMGIREREAMKATDPDDQSEHRGLLSVHPKEEDRKGTWGDRHYEATDAEAHRDSVYSIPSFMKQTLIMFMVQMRLFGKQRWTFIMLFVALLIPILTTLASSFVESLMTLLGATGNAMTYTAGLLSFLPLLLGLFTSILCGKQIPQEFKDRTAYTNIPLPVSRASFYLGKYLAGFALSLGIFMLAYGAAILTTSGKFDYIYADILSESLAITIVGIFAYTSTAFCIGCFMKRGSSIVPFILMSVILPVIILILTNNDAMSPLYLAPCFLGEAALGLLGATIVPSVLLSIASLDLTSITAMIAIGIVWGAVFLVIGLYKTMRREM